MAGNAWDADPSIIVRRDKLVTCLSPTLPSVFLLVSTIMFVTVLDTRLRFWNSLKKTAA